MFPPRILRLSLSTNTARVARSHAGAPSHNIHSTSIILQGGGGQPGRDPHLSQGSVGTRNNLHRGDVQDQAARAGQSSADKSPLDAASREGGMKASHEGLSGNPEGVGFAEQVGGASATDSHSASGGQSAAAAEGMHGKQEATPPGFLDSMKSALGFETTSGEVKQNRGGGEGVTGTGTFGGLKGEQRAHKRAFHTSAPMATGGDRTTTGQATKSSRQPRDSTYSEQNEHLKHREQTDSSHASEGKGNAAENPSLPSHKSDDKSQASQKRRSIHTSARRLEEKHTADSYFKDIDSTPPQSSKTHQVDSSDNKVVRPNEPATGDFSRAGMQTKEYATVDKDEPYDAPGKDEEDQLKYGGISNKTDTVSKPEEGPEGEAKGGRTPERK